MSCCLRVLSSCVLLFAVAGCTQNGQKASDPPIKTAAGAKSAAGADTEAFQVKFETSKGDFIVEVHPSWSPNGADHFRELVEAEFYDDCRFFRVLDGFMAQFGINGDPAVHSKWGDANIQDDPVVQSNTRGYVTFAMTGAPNSRSTQIFVNYADRNSRLDDSGFSPFGQVIEGMDVVDSLYSGYGEGPPDGTGPNQGAIESSGNKYLDANYPKLDYIKRARIVGGDE